MLSVLMASCPLKTDALALCRVNRRGLSLAVTSPVRTSYPLLHRPYKCCPTRPEDRSGLTPALPQRVAELLSSCNSGRRVTTNLVFAAAGALGLYYILKGGSRMHAARAPGLSGTPSRYQDVLVNHMKHHGDLQSEVVERVLRAVDRGAYIAPPGAFSLPLIPAAYMDQPLQIGFDQTISAPSMHAYCLQCLEPVLKPGAHALDVGAGSGYLTACLALMVGPTGRVVGVERFPELADFARDSIARANPEVFGELHNTVVLAGNIYQDDLLGPEDRFDAIHVGAAAESIPASLVARLKPGGRMVIPVGPRGGSQALVQVDKDESGQVVHRWMTRVRYVPLTRPGEE